MGKQIHFFFLLSLDEYVSASPEYVVALYCYGECLLKVSKNIDLITS